MQEKSNSLQEVSTSVATGVAELFDRRMAEVSKVQATTHTDGREIRLQ
jgi:hypothetical protein